MASKNHTPAIIITALIVILGIIHLGVGIGITTKYRRYRDVMQQSVGLSAYNIVIGFYAVAVGIVALFAILKQRLSMRKTVAIMSVVLGVLAVASFIAALVINSQSIGYIRNRLSYRTTSYIENQDSIDIIDRIQTNYQCCGVNLWLDWSRVALGASTGTGTSVVTGRRRRDSSLPLSPLTKSLRHKRQVISTGSTYNLPTSYSINLPLSCCKGGGTSNGNSVGGYCVYGGTNGTTSFYVNGCLSEVANVAVSQVTGIVVINTCLAILAFVLIPMLVTAFSQASDPNNPNDKQSLGNEMYQQQQQQQQVQLQQQPQQQQQYYNGGYYMNNAAPNYYYNNTVPTYTVYQ